MSGRAVRKTRADFAVFVPLTTRWGDNDVYGHINNAIYFQLFDTAVNQLLVQGGVLDVKDSAIVGLVVENRCSFFASLAFPDALEAGVAVERIGTSSVRYRLGLFLAGARHVAAQGEFTHVYVERATQTPVRVPEAVRALLAGLTLHE